MQPKNLPDTEFELGFGVLDAHDGVGSDSFRVRTLLGVFGVAASCTAEDRRLQAPSRLHSASFSSQNLYLTAAAAPFETTVAATSSKHDGGCSWCWPGPDA